MQKTSRGRRDLMRVALGLGTVAGIAVTTLITVPAASAAVPSFPDNIVVFPDRDFVSVEGYSEYAGETATLKVTRGGAVIGSAQAVVSDSGVAFEVNHPGGVCWGAGTSVKVTPDIKAGDIASITLPDGRVDETTTSSATVVKDSVKNGRTVTVEGIVGSDVNKAQMEQRIINPALVDIIGKRDVRAAPGPLQPQGKGGYVSSLEFPTDTTFLATYVFDTQAAADATAAADLGERAMTWQQEDADANRQGLTIAEFGEAGGPGMGGCPAGPAEQGAPTGSFSVVRAAGSTSAQVKWTPVAPQPGADAVTGFAVEAVGPASSGQSSVTGVRVGASATQSTLTGLDPAVSYTYEVRSMAGAKLSTPFTPAPTTSGPSDTTVPTLTVSPAASGDNGAAVEANSVTITSNGQVFYTTDGSPALTGDMPADNALLYAAPIPITAATTLNIATFDQAGNRAQAIGKYTPVTAVAPATPTGLAGTVTQNSAALTWTAPAGTVTGYQVSVSEGATLITPQPPVTNVPRQTISGLKPGTSYSFQVVALNGTAASAKTAALPLKTDAATDRVTVTSAKWKAGDFRIVGTGSVVGRSVQAYRVNADGSRGAIITGASAAVVAAAPPGIGDYSIRLRTGVPTTNPGRIIVVSNGGGVTAPFTVTNG